MSTTYNASDWYWSVAGKTGEVYSSARASYVQTTDAAYVAWLTRGRKPTRISGEASLHDVLQKQFPAGWPTPKTTLTPPEFFDLFEASEETAISTAALSNPLILMWMVRASGAASIDLTAPSTKAGLDALVSAGLITAARETEILTGQVPPAPTGTAPSVAPSTTAPTAS